MKHWMYRQLPKEPDISADELVRYDSLATAGAKDLPISHSTQEIAPGLGLIIRESGDEDLVVALGDQYLSLWNSEDYRLGFRLSRDRFYPLNYQNVESLLCEVKHQLLDIYH